MNKSQKLFFIISFFLLIGLSFFLLFTPKGNSIYRKIIRNVQEVSYDTKLNIPPHLRSYDIVGIDVSHYQEKIDWDDLQKVDSKDISFVFIRATQGKDGRDARFKRNWKLAKEKGFVRGAYHYYRPNENSLAQAQAFIKRVKLEKGDLPPVLDIERLSRIQSKRSLRIGLKKWLTQVEQHFGVEPIIYTGASYYFDIIDHEYFDSYPLWVANYNAVRKPIKKRVPWIIWQFSDKGRIEGIDGDVDLNVFNGDSLSFQSLRIQ